MLKRTLAATFLGVFLNFAFAPYVLASGKTEKEVRFSEKVKTNIAKLGTGEDAKIKLKLKDGTKISGYVKAINDENVVVVDAKTNQTINVPYSGVKQVKGNNLSTGAKILIGVGIFVLVIVIAASSLK